MQPTTLSFYLRGVSRGAAAWLCYGAAEYALAYDYPLLTEGDRTISPWAWPLMAEVLFFYCAFGAVCGLLAAALAGRAKASPAEVPPRIDLGIGLSLALAFGINLLRAIPLARSEYFALVEDALVLVSLGVSIGSAMWRRRLAGLASPWVLAFLLLAAPWISRTALHDSAGWVKLTLSAAAVCGVLAVSGIVGRWRSKSGLAVSLAVCAVVFVVGWVARPGLARLPATAGTADASGHPNIILITMDAVRADHLSAYGYERETTPFLKSLARESTVYTRAISASDMTLPAHASIFTGTYASWHGAHYDPPSYPYGRPLDSRLPTLAETLRKNGYTTIAVPANYAYLRPELGVDRGFQVFDSESPVPVSDSDQPFFLREGVRALLAQIGCTAEFDMVARRADEINRNAVRLLDMARQRQRPFFLFLNYMDAHTPYIPPAPYDRLFPGKDPKFTFQEYMSLQREVLEQNRTMTASQRENLVSQYDGGIAYIDTALASLVSSLKARGIYENTLLIVTGDHGEAFGEKGLVEHAVASVYENQVHVPLIIKYPRTHAADRSSVLVTHTDIMPTVLDVAGYGVPKSVTGRTLLAEPPAGRFIVSEAFPTLLQWGQKFDRLERALYQGNRKLILSNRGSTEVFDLERDPAENQNLYRADNPDSMQMRAELEQWTKAVPHHKAADGRGLDSKVMDRLKSLGYVQ